MNISKETTDIISSFSFINPSILIKPGSILATKNDESTMLAIAEVKDEFPVQMSIYNLKQFLGVVDTFKSPEFIFDESKNFVTIKEANQYIKYGFANPDLFATPKNYSIPYQNEHLKFALSKDTIAKIKKISATLDVSDLIIESSKSGSSITICDSNNSSSNQYKIDINQTSKSSYKMILNLKYFNIMDSDYVANVVSVGEGDQRKYIFFLEGEYEKCNLKYYIVFNA